MKKALIRLDIPTIFGIGLCLFAVNDPALIWHIGGNSATAFFLPWIGALVIIATVAVDVTNHTTEYISIVRTRPRQLMIWGGILIALMIESVIISGKISHAPFIIAVLGGSYLMALRHGMRALAPIVPLGLINALVCIGYAVYTGFDESSGGVVSIANYDLGVAVMAFAGGIIISRSESLPRRDWAQLAIIMLGIVATGAAEGLVSLVALAGIGILCSQNRSSAILIPTLSLASAAIMYGLWSSDPTSRLDTIMTDPGTSWGDGRWPAYHRAISDISILGHGGFSVNDYQIGGGAIAHNVGLSILQQSGPIAMGAWFVVVMLTFYHVSYRRGYALPLMILSLGVFDHMIWTALAPWWWAGMATVVSKSATEEVHSGIPKGKVALHPHHRSSGTARDVSAGTISSIDR